MGSETLTLLPPLALTKPVAAAAAAAAAAAPTALAPGFRFHPTDEELVIYYLKRKVCGKSFRFNAISEVDIYKSEPWDLAGKSRLKSRDQEYYFFSVLDKKYGNGARMNRATSQGYWKATGNDRQVRHDTRTVGLKKTLVFHSGRAPDGKRTNWVMHEYRLVDEELEKAGAGTGSSKDAYVLCRVFHKSNIGPPNGHRYAPFIEEEWDDGGSVLIPGEEIADGVVASHDTQSEKNSNSVCAAEDRNNHVCGDGKDGMQERTQFINKDLVMSNDPPRNSHSFLFMCKSEELEDYTPPSIIANPKPFSLMKYKRRRQSDLPSELSKASENSSMSNEELSLSEIATASQTDVTMSSVTTPTTKNFLSTLVEYSLLESTEPKDSPAPPPSLETSDLSSSVHPSILKFIQDLQHEIHKTSMERETLKFELLSARAMISILQSRIVVLNKEINDLKSN
ncbi:NAC domain containing protein 50-like [Cucurbita moschata]|uniref:NAC domain containing protein 50-like n=1 Tax=Cucurbita moschata TaxID=3662 RepID=A0A6J1G1A0_CUCMO|nr:NAC domain containing protein 50-like [Cucurbita moschata]